MELLVSLVFIISRSRAPAVLIFNRLNRSGLLGGSYT